MRTPLMAGNWKMFKTAVETAAFFEKFIPLVQNQTGRDVVICPPFLNIPTAVESTKGSAVRIGGQNSFWMPEGAYTGEISGPMLRAAGAEYVLVGHSERRQYFAETDETVLKRTIAALAAGLKPIVCIGECLEDRESGATERVCDMQFQGGIAELTPEQMGGIVIAYEPVWAIGTGKTATPQIAEDAHRFIRSLIASKYGAGAASATRILYGGSVKLDNAAVLMGQEDIDGVLVGGASLDPVVFGGIVNY
ncbi:MAG: triose-phosphate isomerase [Bryobacteraceae bacterium]|nr:triose-phosphate isomerase [Bryobacteraceae bacterium]